MKQHIPEILYHYTTMNSLWNIINTITNKGDEERPEYYVKLWFTCVSYMNDPMEEVFFKRCLYGSFVNFQNHNCLKDKSDLLQLAFMALELQRGEGYAISLSESQDSLPMWRAYGANGQGVAIGFDREALASAIYNHKGCKILRMAYKSESEFIRSFQNDELQNAYDAIEEKDNGSGSVGFAAYEYLYDKYQHIKNSSYEGENEWRLVINHDLKRKTDFRERNGLIIPYYTIELPLEVIKCFVIGPCAEQELSKRSLDNMLFHKANGFRKDENKISLSSIPYVLR